MRYGLYARSVTVLLAAMLITLAVIVLILQRQDEMREEMLAHSRDSLHGLAFSRLRAHGEGQAEHLAASLVNPLYYFDLDAIGAAIAHVQRQPDVDYVIVYSAAGEVIHDGSRDIATYGQAMADAFAPDAVAADAVRVQSDERVFDVAAPVWIGEEKLGGVRIGYSLASVRADEHRATAALRDSLLEIGRRHLQWVALLLTALVLLGVAMSFIVQRALVRPIRQLAEAAREIEAGNFSAEVPASRRNDEVGDLMRGFRRMGESIVRHDRDIRRMAYTDSLTGLANRLAFREILDQRMIQSQGAARRLALLFTDIDDFKRVNDTLGHDAGDEVLMSFAERIRTTVEREGGDGALLARFGGDEFVVLVEAMEGDIREIASRLAGRLVEEVGRPIVIEQRQVFLGISIGVTLFPEDASGATMLMKNADIAMYQAKLAGKNCYRFYSRAMDQAVERRVRMEQDLRGAWERGELSLVYQPVFRMADNRLLGAEALLRWKHPTQGMVAPSIFIEVAEQSGLIETLGPAVLRAACIDATRWHRELGHDELFVAVNVSPRQLRAGNLARQVEDVLRETGMAPRRLHLELTETAVIGDELHISSLLARLRTSGVQVWLDDFGTGFSGLSHLRRVPIDGVKIDRSFVADVLRDPDDLALTTAIIAMAHSLGMTVVAEGVEQEGQFEVLRERGCDLAQGYWLGHPMSSQELARLIG
ncbi:EAL domain-containing protein [Luteimonas sp. SJ-92]|uniref:EAL domain-containing protein n=2 Tax=Luteimonas salinisoli TaxID=2752307 RepID=A0A853JI60_9GAMM|nr:GGDEF domain-containing phosphodiesterase [Luteimonas salinisoli]NZA28100.1 EAL domain-containing protein [Luteimonas salinisoli]